MHKGMDGRLAQGSKWIETSELLSEKSSDAGLH
jgi:hypothetical protein